jgi:hypothetical protein
MSSVNRSNVSGATPSLRVLKLRTVSAVDDACPRPEAQVWLPTKNVSAWAWADANCALAVKGGGDPTRSSLESGELDVVLWSVVVPESETWSCVEYCASSTSISVPRALPDANRPTAATNAAAVDLYRCHRETVLVVADAFIFNLEVAPTYLSTPKSSTCIWGGTSNRWNRT